MRKAWRWATCALIAGGLAGRVAASDHLDTPSVIADPRADIGDLYAWMSPDRARLNLVMTIVGHSFSDRLAYVFHIDSGARIGRTTATLDIVCRFDAAQRGFALWITEVTSWSGTRPSRRGGWGFRGSSAGARRRSRR